MATDSFNEIDRNYPGDAYSTDSFIGKLHETQVWDVDAYWKFEAAVYRLTAEYQKESQLPRDIALRLDRISRYVLNSFCRHHASKPNTRFRIDNLSDNEAAKWQSRFELSIQAFFTGDISLHDLPDFKIANPLLVDERGRNP